MSIADALKFIGNVGIGTTKKAAGFKAGAGIAKLGSSEKDLIAAGLSSGPRAKNIARGIGGVIGASPALLGATVGGVSGFLGSDSGLLENKWEAAAKGALLGAGIAAAPKALYRGARSQVRIGQKRARKRIMDSLTQEEASRVLKKSPKKASKIVPKRVPKRRAVDILKRGFDSESVGRTINTQKWKTSPRHVGPDPLSYNSKTAVAGRVAERLKDPEFAKSIERQVVVQGLEEMPIRTGMRRTGQVGKKVGTGTLSAGAGAAKVADTLWMNKFGIATGVGAVALGLQAVAVGNNQTLTSPTLSGARVSASYGAPEATELNRGSGLRGAGSIVPSGIVQGLHNGRHS